jgi:hypothetical protein
MGDYFVVADHDMDDEVFVLSNMIAEVYRFQDADVIGFNGTTEWALDSVEQTHTLWLPREEQIRMLLAGTVRSLTKIPAGWQVAIEVSGNELRFSADQAEEAYGLALLYLVAGPEATAG